MATRNQKPESAERADRSRRRFLKLSSFFGLAAAFSPKTLAETVANLLQPA